MADKTFRDKTKDSIEWFSDWLRENSDNLADTFSGGEIYWDISLRWGTADALSDGVPRMEFYAEKFPSREICGEWLGYNGE